MPTREAMLEAALGDPNVRRRYEQKVVRTATHWWWVGAVMKSGHGRFWLGQSGSADVVVLAHRFGYALTHGLDALNQAPVLEHDCDEALCQNPRCLIPSNDNAQNHEDWRIRRHRIGSPLRDIRGPAGRAKAIRAALLEGGDVNAAIAAGVSDLDRSQLTLFDLPLRDEPQEVLP